MKKNKIDPKEFYRAVTTLSSVDECEKFFQDICTIQELEAIAQRFQVARLLDEGKSYVDINKLTGASTATICRVSKCLNYGDGGYKTAIERIKENEL